MIVADKHVVQFHYQLSDQQGNELESSRSRAPMAYLHGSPGILPGLAAQMAGKSSGESFSVTLDPKDAFGEIQPDAEQRVPIKHLHADQKLQKGVKAVIQTDNGQRQVTVVKVGKFMATIDINHPMAGKTVTFDIEIIDVRPATEEELAHGHAHGVGGHHH